MRRLWRSGQHPALSPKAELAARRFEIPVLAASLGVVPVVVLQEQSGASPVWQAAAAAADWVIWSIFAIELLVVVALNRNHAAALRRYWLNAVIVVVSAPILPVALAMTRLSRITHLAEVLRLLRLVRLAAILSRGGQVASSVFRGHGLGYVISVTALLAAGFGTLFAFVEPDVATVIDGLWLAVVTVTSVGYGDIVPTTGVGRFAGTMLMLLGVGCIAALTAAVAARFVADDEAQLREDTAELDELVRGMQAQLDRIEQRLGGVSSDHDDTDRDATRILGRTPYP